MTERSGERLFVRVDATPLTGLGHFMRCLALAQAWQDRGGAVSFIGRYGAQSVERLSREAVECIALEDDLGLAEDLAATLAAIPPQAPIALDGYAFDPTFQRGLAHHGRLLTIDDTGHWPAYAGALLLNQNPHAAAVGYGDAPAVRLLGYHYVLLTREFAEAPAISSGAPFARRWLVSLGGADVDNIGGQLAGALAAAAPEAEIRLLVGPLNRHRARLAQMAATFANLELVDSPADMLETLSRAELAVSAAGTTALQLARLGVPTLLLAIADNQEPLGRSLESDGACVYLGRWPQVTCATAARATIALATDVPRRAALGGSGRRLIDGQGARRVAAALAAAAPASGNETRESRTQ
jgi:UDP-2,4-diacetamido-2,4,6-trideoxy-beta-L-altropyranose hydrolase